MDPKVRAGWRSAARPAALLACVALLAGCSAARAESAPATAVPAHPGSPAAPPRTTGSARIVAGEPVQVVVIGDSLTSGYATPGYPWTIPAQQDLDGDGLSADIVNSSAAGIGYQATGGIDTTFADLVAQVVTAQAGVVVLFGSDNDTDGPSLAASVEATLELVTQQAPHADVVVVGPPVTPAQDGADLDGIAAALRTAAAQVGARYVDTSDWFAGNSASLLGADGEHPNIAGEDYLGARFAALLAPMIRARLAAAPRGRE